MDVITLDAKTREPGKKATKALRREDLVPCVLYGHGIEPMHIGVPTLTLRPLIFTHEAHRIALNIDGKEWDCVLKNVDFDPLSDDPRHADFQVLIEGEKVRLTVPLQFTGTPAGKEEGGVTEMILTEVEVLCLPKDMRSSVEVDISELNIGDAIHIRELQVEGLEFLAPADQTVVAVYGRGTHLEELEEDAEAEAEAEAAAAEEEGEAGADEGEEA